MANRECVFFFLLFQQSYRVLLLRLNFVLQRKQAYMPGHVPHLRCIDCTGKTCIRRRSVSEPRLCIPLRHTGHDLPPLSCCCCRRLRRSCCLSRLRRLPPCLLLTRTVTSHAPATESSINLCLDRTTCPSVPSTVGRATRSQRDGLRNQVSLASRSLSRSCLDGSTHSSTATAASCRWPASWTATTPSFRIKHLIRQESRPFHWST